MTLLPDSSLLIIKPLSISRGDGPSILADCLNNTDLALIKFREWAPCTTTLMALSPQFQQDVFPLPKFTPIWICLFTSLDQARDPYTTLTTLWTDTSILSPRRKYRQDVHPSDTLIRITDPARLSLECDLLF